jgi:hypothetical protein
VFVFDFIALHYTEVASFDFDTSTLQQAAKRSRIIQLSFFGVAAAAAAAEKETQRAHNF